MNPHVAVNSEVNRWSSDSPRLDRMSALHNRVKGWIASRSQGLSRDRVHRPRLVGCLRKVNRFSRATGRCFGERPSHHATGINVSRLARCTNSKPPRATVTAIAALTHHAVVPECSGSKVSRLGKDRSASTSPSNANASASFRSAVKPSSEVSNSAADSVRRRGDTISPRVRIDVTMHRTIVSSNVSMNNARALSAGAFRPTSVNDSKSDSASDSRIARRSQRLRRLRRSRIAPRIAVRLSDADRSDHARA